MALRILEIYLVLMRLRFLRIQNVLGSLSATHILTVTDDESTLNFYDFSLTS